MGDPALGWRYGDVVDVTGHHVIEEVEDELRVVERIHELHASGLSMRRIATTLAAEGWRTKRGGRWHAATIQRVLRRRVA